MDVHDTALLLVNLYILYIYISVLLVFLEHHKLCHSKDHYFN